MAIDKSFHWKKNVKGDTTPRSEARQVEMTEFTPIKEKSPEHSLRIKIIHKPKALTD